jgi:hypothetical protein
MRRGDTLQPLERALALSEERLRQGRFATSEAYLRAAALAPRVLKACKGARERLSARLGPEIFAKIQALAAALDTHPARDEALAFLLNETRPPDRLESGS